jgi:CRISPR system Cascade subunit CasA
LREPYSLTGRAWLPVATTAGRREVIRIRDIARPDPRILRIDTGRPDCDISVTEFLIGLLAISALAPREKRDWKPRFFTPPSPEKIDEAVAPFAHALVLDGPGPRFFQDFEPLEGDETAVAALLMDQPGGKTQTDNADFFVKRGGVKTLSRGGAAIALLTLQTSAPGGGAGHRTSLRGGGPVTTLVIPRVAENAPSLWQILWANVPAELRLDPDALQTAMPWLGATRTSNKNEITTPEHVHPAQAFFGMPRRVRLNFEANTARLPCDLLGEVDDVIVQTYITRPYGTNYTSWGKSHPLSPYYKQREQDSEWLPLHFKSSAVGYRQWTGLVLKHKDGLRVPSDNIAVFLNERRRDAGISAGNGYKAGILACGYAMDNMKPLDFTEAYLPIIVSETEDGDRELATRASEMVKAANYAVSMLAQTLNAALFGGQGKAGTSFLDGARARFWSSTEEEFYAALRKTARYADPDPRAEWLRLLRDGALAIFDGLAPVDAPESLDIKNVVQARSLLLRALSGKKFYAEAGLPPPQNDKPKRRAA